MPMTEKGKKVMFAMKKQYGAKKGKQVFYASKNKGTIKGVDKGSQHMMPGKHMMSDAEMKMKVMEHRAKT